MMSKISPVTVAWSDPSHINISKVNPGIVACESSDDKVVVYVDDTSEAPKSYEFTVYFSTIMPSLIPKPNLESTHLRISATIDGSDRLIITAEGARWEHKAWDLATDVSLNNVRWPLEKSRKLKNEGSTRFLPANVDFSTAKIVGRSGRDLVTADAQSGKLIVSFADNPVGSDQYDIDIAFGNHP